MRRVWITLRFASLVAALLGRVASADAQTTAFFYDSQPGDIVGKGQHQTVTSNDATFRQSISDYLAFDILGPGIQHQLLLRTSASAPVVGTYLGARYNGYVNGLSVAINGLGCGSTGTGRFIVLEAVYNADGTVLRFAIDFEFHCLDNAAGLVGAFRYNSTVASLVPFGGQYPRYSLDITPSDHGIVTGGSIACGSGSATCHSDFAGATAVPLVATPNPGYVFTGWTGDCAGITRITLTVNQARLCAASFDAVTPASPRTMLLWNSASGDPLGGGQSDVYNTSNSLWTAKRSVDGRSVTVEVFGNSAAGRVHWTLQFAAPLGEQLQAGQYTDTTEFGGAGVPGMVFWGEGESCGGFGQFTVRQLAFGSGTSVSNVAIDFEMHCGVPSIPPTPPVMGTIEYNASVALPVVGLSKNALALATTRNASQLSTAATPAQTVRLIADPSVSWTATADQPWLSVVPRSGTGSATLSVSVRSTIPLPTTSSAAANVTLAVSGASNNPGPIAVSVAIIPSGATLPPFGSFDTPVNGVAGVSGSIAVTGWALDDLGVTGVRILRGPVTGETPGQLVFIGNAAIIDGARPDVASAFPTAPLNSSAGWGYLLLTNFLPNSGNGTFTLYAIADDADGHSTLLGTKTIACDNAHATAPFGAIDTPGQGAVASGIVANFGWVLSVGLRRSDPPGGGTVTVFVDGAAVGTPSAWTSRSDLSSFFPLAQYSGISTALGIYGLDTTTLSNGVHTISWSVTDNLGATSGVGSRFFIVSNGSNLVAAAAAAPDVADGGRPEGLRYAPGSVLLGRRGFDLSEPLDYFFPDLNGVVTIDARELDRIELQLEPGATGALITPQGGKPLPIGAQIDASTGVFTWAPGAGFIGSYTFVFGSRVVHIVLHPAGGRGQ
jgi:uncharacterized repeat protein (TIGR02543 family)